MLYYANPCSVPAVKEAMRQKLFGCITTPSQGNRVPEGALWCADNGCFGKGYPGDQKWLDWLASRTRLESCAFATAPDVVGNAQATLERSVPFLSHIRNLGYPAAFVGQDGLEELPVPWDEFDVLFIGGTTEWKLGPEVALLAAEANKRGKRVHMGRVNSYKRLQYAHDIGCSSADGTFLTFAPTTDLPRLLRWLEKLN